VERGLFGVLMTGDESSLLYETMMLYGPLSATQSIMGACAAPGDLSQGVQNQ
jgi:hypothetical protein